MMTPRRAAIIGWTIAVLSAAVVTLELGLWVRGSIVVSWATVILAGFVSLTYAVIGALVVGRRPANRLGWVFIGAGVLAATSSFTQAYGGILTTDPGSSAARLAAWLTDLTNALSLGLLTVFMFLLFPRGRLVDKVSRLLAIVAIAGIVIATIGSVVERRLQDHPEIPAPFAPSIPEAVATSLYVVGYSLLALALVGSIVLLVVRLRRGVGRERDQLRLLAWAAAVGTVLLIPALFLPPDASAPQRDVSYLVGGVGLLLIPVSVGVAILRHRLLDIDVVIRRTVVIALLGAFITAIYVGVVVGVGAAVGRTGNALLSAIAAALVALAFQPVRRWARRLADRLVYGARATPYEVLHEFSERVAGSYRTEDVLPRMATILGEGTRAERAQVWLRIGGELRPAAVWPEGAVRSRPVQVPEAEALTLADVSLTVPVADRGELLGALTVSKPPSDPVTATEEKLVADLALQAGLVLRNVRLVEDLRASRQRLVKAQDEERRRLERDIHDGAQQQLVALQVKQRLAEQLTVRDPAKAVELLRELQLETGRALDELRDLARGIYPPLLADRGLAAALESQARKAIVPVDVLADGTGRYPQEVEATVYFCCLEAIQNAAKYAEASHVEISLAEYEGELRFEVRDDGRGFDPGTTPRGAGLQNMSDRLEAVGGSLEVDASPDQGARIRGRIPIAEGDPT